MKIFYLITKSELGGAQTHIVQLVSYFKNKGNEVAVMSAPGGWLETEVRKNGAEFFPNIFLPKYFNPFAVWRAYFEIKKAIGLFQPDIIACHSTVAGALGRLAVRNKIPTVFTAHGWCFDAGAGGFKKMAGVLAERWLARYAVKIICVAQFVKDSALRNRVAKEERMAVVRNGIAIPVNEPVGTTEKSDFLRIIFIGRLSSQKDPFTLIKGFSLLSEEAKQKCRIIVIGAGPSQARLSALIKNLKLATSVELTGGLPRTRVFDILKHTDIFVLTANWEGFPYTVLEAMACGLPVIATDVGGVKEALSDECGLLVKQGDIIGVSNALEKLINSPELRARFGVNARRRVEDYFPLKKMCVETEIIYEEAVKKKI